MWLDPGVGMCDTSMYADFPAAAMVFKAWVSSMGGEDVAATDVEIEAFSAGPDDGGATLSHVKSGPRILIRNKHERLQVRRLQNEFGKLRLRHN